jgi:hypothetical protein
LPSIFEFGLSLGADSRARHSFAWIWRPLK